MPNFICVTCGTQYPDSLLPAEACAIGTEERQYLGAGVACRIADAVEAFEPEQIYGGWFGRNILEGGRQALRYSARRYRHAIAERVER